MDSYRYRKQTDLSEEDTLLQLAKKNKTNKQNLSKAYKSEQYVVYVTKTL